MSKRNAIRLAVIAPLMLITLVGCAQIAMMRGIKKPAESEFGFGPRKTTNGSYTVVIEEKTMYKTGRMLSTLIRVQDGSGANVDNARITVDGGMPQHGHGLPTRPRVTKYIGNGVYQVEGLKFNMGGWWELKFAINGGMSDNVTFNLEL